jgi:hypothetical protein
MICPTFSTFRWVFATRARSTITATFAANTLTRVAGDFAADGVVAGMSVNVSGATNAANNVRTVITNVAALVLTVADNFAVPEGPTAGVVAECVQYDGDGLETWPVANVRAGGFDDGFTNATTVYTMGNYLKLIPVGVSGVDAVLGVDEYDWYVSQQSDDPAAQLWSITNEPSDATNSRSGQLRLQSTALATTEFPGVTVCTPDATALLFRNVHVYCRRISDGAIQWIDMLEEMLP